MDFSRDDLRATANRFARDMRRRGADMAEAAPTGAAAGMAVLGIAALGGYVAYRALRGDQQTHGDDAPWASSKSSNAGVVSGEETIQRSITINASVDKIRAAAREHAADVFGGGDRSVHLADDTLTIGDVTYRFQGGGDERRFTVDGDETTHGVMRMAAAPGGRGTTLSVALTHKPLGGKLGNAARGLAQKDAKTRLTHMLKRLKMQVEAGEVADAAYTCADANKAGDK